jgi:hypothetical protein
VDDLSEEGSIDERSDEDYLVSSPCLIKAEPEVSQISDGCKYVCLYAHEHVYFWGGGRMQVCGLVMKKQYFSSFII